MFWWSHYISNNGANDSKFEISKQTPLRRAIQSGDIAVVRQFMQLEGNTTDENKTPLHWAAEEGQVEIVKLLVSEFFADLNASDSAGQTPLHMAAINGRIEVARFIADKVTIAQLNLKGTSELSGFTFACAW